MTLRWEACRDCAAGKSRTLYRKHSPLPKYVGPLDVTFTAQGVLVKAPKTWREGINITSSFSLSVTARVEGREEDGGHAGASSGTHIAVHGAEAEDGGGLASTFVVEGGKGRSVRSNAVAQFPPVALKGLRQHGVELFGEGETRSWSACQSYHVCCGMAPLTCSMSCASRTSEAWPGVRSGVVWGSGSSAAYAGGVEGVGAPPLCFDMLHWSVMSGWASNPTPPTRSRRPGLYKKKHGQVQTWM
jgi:hypothetical protein